MTLSDAEEDQPSQNSTRRENCVGLSNIRISTGTTTPTSNSSSSNHIASHNCSSSISETCNINTAACVKMNEQVNADDVQGTDSSNRHDETISQNNDIVTNNSGQILNSVSESQQTEVALINGNHSASSVPELEYKKIKEKLEQIDRYIEQTTNTMHTLENEGNMALEDNLLVTDFEALFDAIQIQETDCYNLLNKSLMTIQNASNVTNGDSSTGDETRESGSESLGMVGSINENGNRSTIHERLNMHESEQELLSSRLRESLVRRQELMVRYQATKDRLENLKRQRTAIAQEERNILQDAGASVNPYEDPIPEAETWTELQLENSIEDFKILRNKVDSLHEVYNAKVLAIDEDDIDTISELHRKIEKVLTKRSQLDNAITRMVDLLHAKNHPLEKTENVLFDANIRVNQSEVELAVAKSSAEDISVSLNQQQEVSGAESFPNTSEELLSKQHHLQSLRDQLTSMKQLLKVTQETMPAPPPLNARIEAAQFKIFDNIEDSNIIDSTVVGVNGDIIHLSETERRDPRVASKYKQLAEAKERLTKMEEVMNLIAAARDSGKPIGEILSPENLAILADAQEEERLEFGQTERNDEPSFVAVNPSGQSVRNRITKYDSSKSQHPIKNSVNEFKDRRCDWERDREITAMQQRLKKKTPSGISSVNDGSRVGREKGAIKKQTKNIFSEGNDPRETEVKVLQEELNEKKNALEALMKEMGKSSSFALDNFSDNISENVSDLNSETVERPTASWGDTRFLSHLSPSDIEAVIDPNEDLSRQFQNAANIAYPIRQTCAPPKNRDHLTANKMPRNTQFSVNNLTDSIPRSVRPKQNRPRVANVPVTTWENISGQDPSSNKVQNTVFSAMTQLTQVQETINSLYDELRSAERSASLQANASVNNMFASTSSAVQPNVSFATNPQNMMTNFQQVPVLNSQGSEGNTNPMLSGLQQCFSQLYLHSLEIQSLNKHLQMIDQRESSCSPSYPLGGSAHRLADQPQRVDDQRVTVNPNFGAPTYAGDKQEPLSFPQRERIAQNESRNLTHGISNPLFTAINTDHSPTWIDSGDKNYYSPLNEASNRRYKNDTVVDLSYPSNTAHGSIWTPMASVHVNNQQPANILNNQVLPGTRANNYWDNFRSYSHQNPLSTAAKCNTGERRAGSSNSLPGTSSFNSNERQIRTSASFENRQYNLTSGSNNSINKASDKNSSTSRCQNRSHARHTLPSDPRMAPPTSDSQLSNHRQRNRKRNNRLNHGAPVEQEEPRRNYSLDTSDLVEADRFRRTSGENDDGGERRMPGLYEMSEEFLTTLNRGNEETSQEDLSTSETHSQVMREAESLMQKHSQQPEFLLQLFHHASRITRNTDQHVALELLRDLSNQRQRSNIQQNRWNSNSSATPSENLSVEHSLFTRGERSYRNNTRLANKQNRNRFSRGISGSDASESGITSEEEEARQKITYQMKNITSASSGLNYSQQSSPQNYTGASPSCLRISPIPSLAGKSGGYKESTSAEFSGKIKFENPNITGRNQGVKRESDNISHYNLSFPGTSPMQGGAPYRDPTSPRNEAELRSSEEIFGRTRQSPRREVTQGEERQTNFVLKNRQKNFNVNSSSRVGFESIVSAALREVLRVFEWPENNVTSNVRVLETLHHSIMKQVQIQSASIGFSTNFVSAIEAQLKTTLQGFYGKRISQIRQELAATVTQVLIHQYCSLLVHQENPSDYIQPQTPDSNHIEENKFETDKVSSANRSFNNATCVNSFCPSSDGVMKHCRLGLAKPNWSYNNVANDRDDKHAAPREETKKNSARSRGGAIAKTSTANNDRGGTKRESSPVLDASFPESRIGARSAAALNLESMTTAEAANERSRSSDNAELIDVEADRADLGRSRDFLPLHDLAEADQSLDAIEVECVVVSSMEDDLPDLSLYAQTSQHQDSPVRLLVRRILGANNGLDEVPTRLLSGPDGASPPLPDNIGSRHPPEGGGANEGRSRPPVAPPQYADSRHPPEGGGAQAVQSNYQADSTGKSG